MKDKILVCAAVILALIFPLSFLAEKKTNSLKTYETAFLNPKNENQIQKIEIESAGSNILLENRNGFFTGSNPDKTYVFPAEQKTVKNFISALKKVRKISKIEDSGAILNDKSYSFKISYMLKDGSSTSILIGKTDITETKRFIIIPGNSGVFKTESDFEPFLTTSADFWVCPEIVWNFSEKTEAEEIQKISWKKNGKNAVLIPSAKDFLKNADLILSLRHGKLAPVHDFDENSDFLEIEFTSGEFSVRIVPAAEDYILVYKNSGMNYAAEISGWTYGRITEIFSGA